MAAGGKSQNSDLAIPGNMTLPPTNGPRRQMALPFMAAAVVLPSTEGDSMVSSVLTEQANGDLFIFLLGAKGTAKCSTRPGNTFQK